MIGTVRVQIEIGTVFTYVVRALLTSGTMNPCLNIGSFVMDKAIGLCFICMMGLFPM